MMNRRRFLQDCAAIGAISGLDLYAVSAAADDPRIDPQIESAENAVFVPDIDWNLWIDQTVEWQQDAIFLPEDVRIDQLPHNPPTGGWEKLYARSSGADFARVMLPSTVEQHFWGQYGTRSYTPEEYRYAADDAVPQNGAYTGVSWWWRTIQIPRVMQGKRILLKLRGARMRAEVYLNEQLVGYSIMEELPFICDLTRAADPGGKNRLAIRITNPGGRYDWVDGTTIRWGAVNVYRSHGFGGLDRELCLWAVPMTGHIADAWVLNTPEPRTINAFVRIEGAHAGEPIFEVLELATNKVLARAAGKMASDNHQLDGPVMQAKLRYENAQLWDLSAPHLYRLRVTLPVGNGERDVRILPFGFRWFAPDGLGTNAIFRMNGRRIKLYSSISWGFWGLNGLWPTPQLAEREVRQAQRLGLNCLNFHRNVGKEDVFRAHDRLGLLRYMEPGGGKLSIGKLPAGVASNAASIVMEKPGTEADRFSQRFMLAKCRGMVRAFRSHPSLIQYTLQNEIGADLSNPDTFAALKIMHAEDPSRSVVLNDGFSPQPRSAPQAWFSPYNDTMHRSDQEPWAGWWNNHQGAGDQWYDEFYKDADHFTYRQPLLSALVEFGEMEGCAVADNHARMVHQIEAGEFGGNGKSYDLVDHRQILDAYNSFLDRWGFRAAFPTADHLFEALGNKCYESWQQYMENVRICDAVDFAVISGWESTSIENHSGIVDNLRNFKGNPELIASSLRPVRPVAKQHKLCYALGESAVFDLYLLNETGKPIAGKVRLQRTAPDGTMQQLGAWDAPVPAENQFSYTLQKDFTAPAFQQEGIHKFIFAVDGVPESNFIREIWVANAHPDFVRKVRVAVSGALPSLRKQLASLPGVEVVEFTGQARFDLIAASGVVKGSKLDRQIGDETGLEAQPVKGTPAESQIPGDIPEEVLAAVRAGTPLLAVVPDDFFADGVAKQLAQEGAFLYHGQVGDVRAPWMGNWLFVREHPTFHALPANRVLGIHYQAHGKQSNGLQIERAPGSREPEVILAYSRDHDRNIGAASFLCHVKDTPVLVHRAPAFSAPLQQRWLANTIAYLTGIHLA